MLKIIPEYQKAFYICNRNYGNRWFDYFKRWITEKCKEEWQSGRMRRS